MLLRGGRWVVKRRRSYALSDRGAHFCLRLRGGWGKRGDLTWHRAVKHQTPKDQLPKPQTATVATALRPKLSSRDIPEQPGWKNSKYWANIEKRNQINTKNYWKKKRRLCVKLFEVTNTTWENLQIAKHKSVQCAEWMTLICALRFADFLRVVFVISNNFTHNFLFYFQ